MFDPDILRSIEAMLVQQVTLEAAVACCAEHDRLLHRAQNTPWRGKLPRGRKPVPPLPDNYEGNGAKAVRKFVKAYFQPGDELWEYNSVGDTWEHEHGEMGYALVRQGRVVAFEIFMEN